MLKAVSLSSGGHFDLDNKQNRLNELEAVMADPLFWEDRERAMKFIAEKNELLALTSPFTEMMKSSSMIAEFFEGVGEDEEILQDIDSELTAIEKQLSAFELRRMLSGELDSKNCFLSINAGAGGTEACDWALMLARMYRRWAERKKWQVEVIEAQDGEVAGLKSITYKFSGSFAYGYAKAEVGVHRLVRISPFDAAQRRHTSFASVDVVPEITDDITVDINPVDLRIDTYRSSGAGGQHVNVTDSAVRITHMPTGIVVSCQKERSQVQNKEMCMKLLRARLYQREHQKREEEIKAISGEKKEIAWGSQIRSYVFQPYTLVKDNRTGYETGNVEAMMDGELLDGFVEAYLLKEPESEG